MMISKTLIKNRALQGGKPSEILKFTNDSLIEDNINDMFVTIWIGILDTNTGIVTASSAGHEYPFYTDLGGYMASMIRKMPNETLEKCQMKHSKNTK